MHKTDLVALVKDALNDLKARDMRVMDVSRLTSITEYMVICSGTSSRHVRSIADCVIEKAKEAGIVPVGVEGHEFGEWVLVDLDEAVIHIMQPGTRDFYKLENLWDMDAQADAAPGSTRAEPGR